MLLLTGVPGAGKTKLVRAVADRLADRRLSGFTTDEIRESGRRLGFQIVPFDGPDRVMAHTGLQSRARVGRYGVDVGAIDAVVATALALDPGVDLYLVDEIGKMECFSDRFVVGMRELLDSGLPLVATIALRGGGFIADVKRHPDAELWEVTARNRDALVGAVLDWLGAAQETRTAK